MSWKRVRQLLDLDDELETYLLGDRIPSERLYLADRRVRLVAAIKRRCGVEDEDSERGAQPADRNLTLFTDHASAASPGLPVDETKVGPRECDTERAPGD